MFQRAYKKIEKGILRLRGIMRNVGQSLVDQVQKLCDDHLIG
jgi:hypothetical protein